jgi:hypothetical protein
MLQMHINNKLLSAYYPLKYITTQWLYTSVWLALRDITTLWLYRVALTIIKRLLA